MTSHDVNTVKNLESHLHTYVRSGKDNPIAVIGGHYPLERNCAPGVNADDSFGYFPRYTMDLACRLVKAGKEHGKDVKVALLVDDHSQQADTQWYIDRIRGNPEKSNIREKIENYFSTFKIPEAYQKLMDKHGLSEKDIVSPKYHPLVFQESKYREEFAKQTGLVPGCAGEVRLILGELADNGYKKVVGLIPARCQGPTCAAVNYYNIAKKKHNLPDLKVAFAYLTSAPFPSSSDFRNDDETPEGLFRRTVETQGQVRIETMG